MTVNNTPTVWVTNKSGHDFSAAEEFGKLRYLTEGYIKGTDVNKLYRELCMKLCNSKQEDFLLVTGMSSLCMIAGAIMAVKHNKLNLLIFSQGKYLERNLVVDELLKEDCDE